MYKTLNRVADATLPSHESEKSLADQFAFFFRKEIKKMRDTFTPFIPYQGMHGILLLVTQLVTCSLMEGCIPDAFKTAVVTPLIKN